MTDSSWSVVSEKNSPKSTWDVASEKPSSAYGGAEKYAPGFYKRGIGVDELLNEVGVGGIVPTIQNGKFKLGLPPNEQLAKQAAILGAENKGVTGVVKDIATDPLSYAGGEAAAAKIAPGPLGALYGGISGLTNPSSNSKQTLKDRLKNAAEDAVLGLGIGKGSQKIGRAVIKPSFDDSVKKLIKEGVVLTPGQLAYRSFPIIKEGEAKLKSVPVVGGSLRAALRTSIDTFNRAVVNRVLAPVGEKLPKNISAGRDIVNYAEEKLGQKYDKLLPKLVLRPDNELLSDMNSLDVMANTLPESAKRQFKSFWDNIVEPRLDKTTSTMSGENFKKVEGELSYLVRTYRKSVNPADRELAGITNEMRGVLRQALMRSNPKDSQELSKINQAWSMFAKVRDAAVRRTPAGEDPDVFTPGDLLRTIKSSNPRSVFARGTVPLQDLAEAGHQVIPDLVPNSGTTDRAIWAALMSGGATINPYAAGGALAATIPYTRPGMEVLNWWARNAGK